MKQIKNMLDKLKILHDTKFVSIEDDLEFMLTKLTFVSEDNKNIITVLLKDVVSARCTDWLFGNIVLDADILNDAEDKMIIDNIVFAEYMNEILIQKKAYLPLLEKIKNNELLLFQINPSYGAYYVAIAKNISINMQSIE